MNGLSGLATGAKAFLFSALRSPRVATPQGNGAPDVVPRRLFDATTRAPASGAEAAAAVGLTTPGGKRKRVEDEEDAQPLGGLHHRGDEARQSVPGAKRQRGEGRPSEGASEENGSEGRKRSALEVLWDDMAPRRVRQRLEADTAVPPLVAAAAAGGVAVALASPARRALHGGATPQWAANTRFLFATGGAGCPGHRGGAGSSTVAARAGTQRRLSRVLPPAVAQLLRKAGSVAVQDAPELRPLPGDVPPAPPPPLPQPQPAFTAFAAMPAIAETHAAPADNGAAPALPAAGGGSFAFGGEEPQSASKAPKRSTSFGLRKSGSKGAGSDSLLGAALSEMTQGEAPALAPPAASASPVAAFTFGAAAPVAAAQPSSTPGADASTDGAKPAPEPAASAAAVPASPAVAPAPAAFTFGAPAPSALAATATTPAPAPGAASLFTFGATPPPAAPVGGSSPAAPAAAAVAAPAAFTFGAPAPAPAVAAAAPAAAAPFTFGAAPSGAAAPVAAAPAPSVTQPAAFMFGAAPAPQPAAGGAPFAFGGGLAPTPAAAAPAFTFGAPQPPPSAVAQPMGASMPLSPAPAFAFGAPAASQLPGPSPGASFTFGGGAPAPQLAHAFSAPPGLGMPAFGGGMAVANGAAAIGGGFNAGAAPTTARRPLMKAKRPGK